MLNSYHDLKAPDILNFFFLILVMSDKQGLFYINHAFALGSCQWCGLPAVSTLKQ